MMEMSGRRGWDDGDEWEERGWLMVRCGRSGCDGWDDVGDEWEEMVG